jgi:hypothetical protein
MWRMDGLRKSLDGRIREAARAGVAMATGGGHGLVDCDDPLAIRKFCSTLPAFTMEARPVIPVEDAVRVELEAIAKRDELKS